MPFRVKKGKIHDLLNFDLFRLASLAMMTSIPSFFHLFITCILVSSFEHFIYSFIYSFLFIYYQIDHQSMKNQTLNLFGPCAFVMFIELTSAERLTGS